MALFKILKGQEKNLPKDYHEGWAYITTDEGNFYVDISDSERIKIASVADEAIKATQDSSNQNIASTYIKNLSLTDSATAPKYVITKGNGTESDLAIPIAGTSYGGIVTAADQTLHGVKTFDSGIKVLGSASTKPLQVQNIVGLNTDNTGLNALYLQYGNNTDDTIYLGANGDYSFTENGGQYSGNAATATNAEKDSSNQNIASTYIKNIAYFHTTDSTPVMKLQLTFGDGTTQDLEVPIAGKNNSGVITKGSQTIYGSKTFNSNLTGSGNITAKKQLISSIAEGTAPLKVTSTTNVANLNADMVDGLHASNDVFLPNGEDGDKYLPTRAAIWASFNDLLLGQQALVYRGTLDLSNPNKIPTNPASGDVYVIAVAGTLANQYCEIGDIAICYKNASGAVTWDILQSNIDGAVTISGGGAISYKVEDNAIARFDGTTGQIIQNSKILIEDSGNILPTKDDYSDTINLGSSTRKWNTVYATSFEGLATQAISDEKGQNIADTYLANIVLINSDSTPYYSCSNGAGEEKLQAALPIADCSNANKSKWTAGIITAGEQTLSGHKILNSDGALTIQKTNGFNYSGIAYNDIVAESRGIWFSRFDAIGTPVILDTFTFNPSETEPWETFDSGENPDLIYGLLTVDRIEGLAKRALKDAKGNNIANTYLNAITFNSTNLSTPKLIATYPGVTEDIELDLPAASTSNGGIITTGTQSIKGAKTFTTSLAAKVASVNTNATFYLWISQIDSNGQGTVKYDSNLSYNPSTNTLTTSTFKGYLDGTALYATGDASGKIIAEHYLSNITLNSSASAPTYNLIQGDNVTRATTLAIPVAGTTYGGIITADRTSVQTLTGAKKLDEHGSIEITKTGGFIYSAIDIPEDNDILVLWGSDFGGVPKTIDKLIYTASTDTLTVNNLDGIARQAISDSKNQNIAATYVRDVSKDGDVHIRVTKGDGSTTSIENVFNSTGASNYNKKLFLVGAKEQTASQITYTNSDVYIENSELYATKVHNAVWNDYAECRQAETIEPGRVVIEHQSGEMKMSSERLQPGANIISDTYGALMGETEICRTPIAVAGRVLAYTYEDRNSYPLGAAVCSGPNGTISLMTRDEICLYPERIIGTVSEIPNYDVWGSGNIKVNNRIWIKVK